MNHPTIGFVGGGRVTRIILEGFQRASRELHQVVVSDPQPGALEALKSRFPQITIAPGDNAAAARQEIVCLAVHPPALTQAIAGIVGVLASQAIVVSLAPKFTIASLSRLLGGFPRIARVIPNAPSLLGLGFNPVAFGPALGASDREVLTGLLSPLGEHPEVEETKLEAYALLTAMGPTYLWFQLQELRKLAGEFGLTDPEIAPALKRMTCGATRTLLEAGLPADDVMDLIPVKPLKEMEAGVVDMYRSRLGALYAKLKP